MPDSVKMYIDGASRNNPGPASLGVYIVDGAGEPLDEYCEYIGKATNNVAEYTALIRGLDRATRLGARQVEVLSDSQLLVRQLQGQYKVKSANLRGLFIAAKSLIDGFDDVIVRHIPRAQNKRADALANQALDERGK